MFFLYYDSDIFNKLLQYKPTYDGRHKCLLCITSIGMIVFFKCPLTNIIIYYSVASLMQMGMSVCGRHIKKSKKVIYSGILILIISVLVQIVSNLLEDNLSWC